MGFGRMDTKELSLSVSLALCAVPPCLILGIFFVSPPLSYRRVLFHCLYTCSPGQEEGNIPFVENAGFGQYSGNPQVIADTVASWLSSPAKLESMQKAALAAARPQATLDIARDLAEMVFAAKNKKKKNKTTKGQLNSAFATPAATATTSSTATTTTTSTAP
jgi:hypothetical protein